MATEFSKKLRQIIQYSIEESARLKTGYFSSEHLLLGMLRDGDNTAVSLLKGLYINLTHLKEVLESEVKRMTEQAGNFIEIPMGPSEDASRALQVCVLEARRYQMEEVDAAHLLLAIAQNEQTFAARLLNDCGASYKILAVKYREMLARQAYNEDGTATGENSQRRAQGNSEESKTPFLDQFGYNLTKAAKEGKLDPVIGRNNEIERIAQILSRRKKNNPVLIGHPGVGKSAVVEGLALRIIQREVPRALFQKQVYSLNMATLVAGTKYRGQFEERINGLLEEIKANKNIILFIDEIHTIIGAGSANDSMDAANILKPALARGELQCVGATTLDEYRKHIEKDGALERRFQKLMVEPTTNEETEEILRRIKDKYEAHHRVTYTDEAIRLCVKLADRYITDRYFPDKAVDVLDEAGARVHLQHHHAPAAILEFEKHIEQAQKDQEEAVLLKHHELAAIIRDNIQIMQEKLAEKQKEWDKEEDKNRTIVDEERIAQTVAMMTGIPVQKMAQEEGVKLQHLKPHLLDKVIGQDRAVDALVRAIQRSRIGLKDPNKPIGSFLFLGPTGVGKTHLAKQLAIEMFGSADAIIRIDMSEYMEKFNVTRLVGAPPGYVGYDEGGQLTEAVRRRPYSIILLDEIEKAHPDVFNLLLQVLDEGRLTDSYGRTVDFKNTVIILTSNIGTRQLKDFGKGIGFSAQLNTNQQEYAQSVLMKALNKSFSPEFINRLDQIITFDQLDSEALATIIDLELTNVYERIAQIGYTLIITPEAKRYIAEKGYDVQFGARPMKRAIQTYVEDTLSSYIIDQQPEQGAVLSIVLNEEKNEVEVVKSTIEQPVPAEMEA